MLAFVMLLTLVGCGDKPAPEPTAIEASTKAVDDLATALVAASPDCAKVTEAAAAFDAKVKELEAVPEMKVSVDVAKAKVGPVLAACAPAPVVAPVDPAVVAPVVPVAPATPADPAGVPAVPVVPPVK